MTVAPSHGRCTIKIEGADVVQPISMPSPLVTTCYHALIHYCYLVIEVTRRHEVLLADQGDREPVSVESFGSAGTPLVSDSSPSYAYIWIRTSKTG